MRVRCKSEFNSNKIFNLFKVKLYLLKHRKTNFLPFRFLKERFQIFFLITILKFYSHMSGVFKLYEYYFEQFYLKFVIKLKEITNFDRVEIFFR